MNGAFYAVDVDADGNLECWATWIDASGSPYIPEWAWAAAEITFGTMAVPVPTAETQAKILSSNFEEPKPSCDGCRGSRVFRTKHRFGWEYVGYRSVDYADELIDEMHAHAVLIHSTTSSDCVTNAKYEGGQYYPHNLTAQYVRELPLPETPQKKGFNDRWTVAGTQRWRDDGGEWGLGAEFDPCKQFH